jgi:hypothetical protein
MSSATEYGIDCLTIKASGSHFCDQLASKRGSMWALFPQRLVDVGSS